MAVTTWDYPDSLYPVPNVKLLHLLAFLPLLCPIWNGKQRFHAAAALLSAYFRTLSSDS